MHQQAYSYIYWEVRDRFFPRVVEFGALDINGTVKKLFNCNTYHGIDLQSGENVNEIADASTWGVDNMYDAVVCCEVLEHTPSAKAIVKNAHRILRSGGMFFMTCATDPRPEHSAIDGGVIRPYEFYRNIIPEQFFHWCNSLFTIDHHEVHKDRGDFYVTAEKI
jgi:cyclopropane fatty-acyl-phospholipid synthase-like methyltransferase